MPVGVKLAGGRFHRTSFAGANLTRADLRCGSFLMCDFTDADLSYANCEGANFTGSVFRRTKMYRTIARDAIFARTIWSPADTFGMVITLVCETFYGAEVDALWWNSILFMLSMTKCYAPEEQARVKDLMPAEMRERLSEAFRVRLL
ncbi:MAG: pentapeptide repeat-containing protein [Patescibacteria group bacterium]|nr:pentapeptide repeat-containing protein [Patescibacteria group bacterium]